ncbi:uncharacterized protein LOC144950079 [Lampetra fluviatilis]
MGHAVDAARCEGTCAFATHLSAAAYEATASSRNAARDHGVAEDAAGRRHGEVQSRGIAGGRPRAACRKTPAASVERRGVAVAMAAMSAGRRVAAVVAAAYVSRANMAAADCVAANMTAISGGAVAGKTAALSTLAVDSCSRLECGAVGCVRASTSANLTVSCPTACRSWCSRAAGTLSVSGGGGELALPAAESSRSGPLVSMGTVTGVPGSGVTAGASSPPSAPSKSCAVTPLTSRGLP